MLPRGCFVGAGPWDSRYVGLSNLTSTLALLGGSLSWLVVAILLSGVYIAAEKTLEKAAAAEFLPRELRSLGFGILASVNAVGDMASSLCVGFLLEGGNSRVAFSTAAIAGTLGVLWLAWFARKGR